MPLLYIVDSVWRWFADTGINLIILLVLAFIVPRIGRFTMRIVRRNLEKDEGKDETKNQLAFAGVGVYVAQIIAFFVIAVFFLQQLGFSLAGAAIPATVASAAIGFGAQSIIADFLSGFFILTEKQFGVGDWVRFEGNGVEVEGTVIRMTMRSTQIRTISQETVNIPNSTAKVCVNNSNYWSRAVVVMPVPLLGSDSIQEVIARSEGATRRALSQEDVAAEVIGELDVHPAVDVTPPTVVGMPWTVNMRFLVQVTAGNQWMVERAIRTSIIEEFWSEYGSATTTAGTFVDHLSTEPEAAVEPPAQVDTGSGSAHPSTTAFNKSVSTPASSRSSDEEPGRPDLSVTAQDINPEDDDADSHQAGIFRTDSYPKRWQQFLSLGGRVRMSTSLLAIILAVLLLLKGLTVQTGESWDGRDGWLAPRESGDTTATSTSETFEPEESPTQMYPEQSEPTAATTVPTEPNQDTQEQPQWEETQQPTQATTPATPTAESTQTPATTEPNMQQNLEPTPVQ